ncbi:hypothetical protein [Phaeobacter sp. B1627]|uniref:hypothetical protein n=1 Tax=Phaeobacter sp. B1627 TaxID=2583809 RepID=UPI00111A372B|nr:hypothetical protein [Phaeobacter sp. B1627]TNJ39065.1 hypothetical protein FGE21_19250 [Phaeobacter sp. B1627]
MAMIENSDRGITLNKSLAWTVACGLVGAGLWVGMQLATVRGETKSLADSINAMRVDMTTADSRQTALAVRVRANETSLARQDERLSLILSTLNKIDTRLERMERTPSR